MATRCQNMLHPIANAEQAGVERHILMDGHGAVTAVATAHQFQPALPLGGGIAALLIAGRDVLALRQDPDLQEMHRRILGRIVFAMRDATAGTHALHLAWPDRCTVTQ